MIVCMAGFLAADNLSAVNPVRIDTVRTRLAIPRPALESLPTPLVKSPEDAIDTLDTANEYIKVILYANNTINMFLFVFILIYFAPNCSVRIFLTVATFSSRSSFEVASQRNLR